MEKVKINLDILLPEIPDERDACIQRLIELAKTHKGLNDVHLVRQKGGVKTQLCFHYDPDTVSLADVERLAKEAGAKVSQQYGHALIEIKAFRELSEATALENRLRKIKGIEQVSVSAMGNIRLEFLKQQITQEQIVEEIIGAGFMIQDQKAHEDHQHGHDDEGSHHEHGEDDDDHDHGDSGWKAYAAVAISLVMLLSGIAFDHYVKPEFFKGWVRVAWYTISYLPVGLPVAIKGINYAAKGDVFTEFILMTLATVGAFYIGEYPEGVTVMLFYTIGEIFQDLAVNRAKRSIKALLDIRPNKAFVKKGEAFIESDPQKVEVGDIVQIKAGEKVPLDGELLMESGTFNTAVLTGESQPSSITKGEMVLAGMINQDKVIEIKVTKGFNDSSLARILFMVQEATTRKAKTEQFIRKFSRIYTPIVVFLAVGITLLPYFFVKDYVFNDWLYRSLIFLVISCPCALVISIPLGYFGGIGAASRNGILFKGSNFLDLITKVNTVVMDKTGTLTKGVFKVQDIVDYNKEVDWLSMAGAIESQSTHPIAKAIVDYAGEKAKQLKVEDLEEISGHGLKARINNNDVLAGNAKLMEKMGIPLDETIKQVSDTIVVVAVNQKLAGYITISDEIKPDSKSAIRGLHNEQIETVMLSGDKQAVVDKVAKELNIDKAFGGLLPENKVQRVEDIKKDASKVVAFMGDGINDAPVLAVSDIGMAMGGLGSDAAIGTADVIIQTDQPSKISLAIHIGRITKRIVWQNIGLAFGVKVIVLALGAGGIATMWEAVFADVGVALLAILNAVRIQKRKF